MHVVLSLLVSVSISLLTLVIFFMLALKYFKDKHINYRTHALTKLLAILTFFIFLDSSYYSFLYASQYGYISSKLFFMLLEPAAQLFPKLGIFLSVVFTVHFIMEKHIEKFKDNEESLQTLESLNGELEKKAMQLESSQGILQKKVQELERFNQIAKSREESMVELIKKIEFLEKKLNKKK